MQAEAGLVTMKEQRAAIAVWFFALVGSVVLVLLTLAAPALRSRSPRLSALLYAVFAPLCHQDPGRCFHYAGYPLAVCGRCLGIDIGFVLGTLLYPFVRGFTCPFPTTVRTFLMASLPVALDGAGNVLGLWSSPIGVRFATGVLWGAVLPAYFIAGMHELAMRIPRLRTHPPRDPRLNSEGRSS
jgi:uncharacterized membrane protein